MQFFSLTVLQILIIPWSIRLLAEDRLRFILASRTWDRDLSLPSLILKASIKTYRTVSTFLQSGGEPWRIERQLGSSPSTSGLIRYEAGIYFAWFQVMKFAVRSLLCNLDKTIFCISDTVAMNCENIKARDEQFSTASCPSRSKVEI